VLFVISLFPILSPVSTNLNKHGVKKNFAGLLTSKFKRREYKMLTGPEAVEMCRGIWFKQVPPSLIIRDDDLNAGMPGFLQRRTPPFPVSLLR
jgi:hypothetical protein